MSQDALYASLGGGGSGSIQISDGEVVSYANGTPTATRGITFTQEGSTSSSVSAEGGLPASAGSAGDFSFTADVAANAQEQLMLSMRQVGNGGWTVTDDWFSLNQNGSSSTAYEELNHQPNLFPLQGQTTSSVNDVSISSSSSQSLSKTGTANNYALALQQSNSQGQSLIAHDVLLGAGGGFEINDWTRDAASSSLVSVTGQQINGLETAGSLGVDQSSGSWGWWHDGSWWPSISSTYNGYTSWSPQSSATYDGVWWNRVSTQLGGSSASGTGQSQSLVLGVYTLVGTLNGQPVSWVEMVGPGSSSGSFSWPVPQSPSPPPPPVSGNSGNWLLDLPPQPFSGPDLVDQVEGQLRTRAQMEAMGQTPPPLTAGSAPVYGSDGNRTGEQALVQASQMAIQMLSTSSGPILGLGFNAAMAFGSAYNGNGQDTLTYGSQALLNAAEIVAISNPCGWVAKGLAAYGVYSNVSDMLQNGVTPKNILLTLYSLAGFFGACFSGDMLLLCEGGKKRADAIGEGDKLWSRSEHDPDGPLVLKRVLRVFERTAKIWHVRVAGQVLRTTVEHPFWVENRQSWLPVGELRVGDKVRTDAGELLAVEEIEDSGAWEKVYNWEVEDYHTYFVSASEDAPSVWAHNTCDGDHHYVPRFMGSLVPLGDSILTFFKQVGHIAIHRALNQFLKPLGMAPSNTNPGASIIRNFSRTERLKALVQFYKQYQGGAHYQAFLDELRQTMKMGLFQ